MQQANEDNTIVNREKEFYCITSVVFEAVSDQLNLLYSNFLRDKTDCSILAEFILFAQILSHALKILYPYSFYCVNFK